MSRTVQPRLSVIRPPSARLTSSASWQFSGNRLQSDNDKRPPSDNDKRLPSDSDRRPPSDSDKRLSAVNKLPNNNNNSKQHSDNNSSSLPSEHSSNSLPNNSLSSRVLIPSSPTGRPINLSLAVASLIR